MYTITFKYQLCYINEAVLQQFGVFSLLSIPRYSTFRFQSAKKLTLQQCKLVLRLILPFVAVCVKYSARCKTAIRQAAWFSIL